MKIGIQCVISQGHVPAVVQAVEAERRGFDIILHGEHHHMPVATPVPDFYRDTGVPDFYRFVPDPLITLAAMATAAPGIRVGTGILLLPIHDTLMAANQMGTLDYLSGGRTVFGFGVGWNEPELANHGVEFATRSERMCEQMQAIKRLWSNETAAFSGTHVRFEESWQGPKPVQQPHPPMLLGGRALKRNFKIIADHCDGWLPTDTYAKTYGGDLEVQLANLADAVRSVGRDPATLRNMMLLAELMLYDREPNAFAAAAPTRDTLGYYETLGFEWVVIGIPSFSEAHFFGALEHIARVAEPWLQPSSTPNGAAS